MTPSSVAVTPSKPIVTTAPSQQSSSSGGGGGGGNHHQSSYHPNSNNYNNNVSTLPALKQKTGIVKSKIPPPVPPRGSPKDRRGQQQQRGASPKGTPPSSGSYTKNHLNDKYFDACGNVRGHRRQSSIVITNDNNNNNNDYDRPIFGASRSPSCVEDWLEINNFDVFPQPNEISPQKQRPISITEKFLQRDNNQYVSPRHSTSSSPSKLTLVNNVAPSRPNAINVKSTLDQIKRQLDARRDSAAVIIPVCDLHEITELRRSSKVTQFLSAYAASGGPPTITSFVTKKPAPPPPPTSSPPPPLIDDNRKNIAILASLRPARRKKRPAPRAEDIYCNAKEKQKIMTTLSCIELHSNDDNYDRVIDSFSLEGEFV